MQVHNYEASTGRYLSSGPADEDQLSPGEFHLPAFATFEQPPPLHEGQEAFFRSGGWVIEVIPEPVVEALPEEPAQERVEDVTGQRLAETRGMLEQVAKSWGYQSTVECISYADEPAVPRFQVEGMTLRRWRSLLEAAAISGDPYPEMEMLELPE